METWRLNTKATILRHTEGHEIKVSTNTNSDNKRTRNNTNGKSITNRTKFLKLKDVWHRSTNRVSKWKVMSLKIPDSDKEDQ